MANPRSDVMNAKRKLSIIFDQNGETFEEENIDEDGISTKIIKKTPGDKTHLSDTYPTYNENSNGLFVVGTEPSIAAGSKEHLREMSNDSIATPPSFGEPPAEAFGDGPDDLSPHIGKDGRYLTNAEFYGEGQADLWNSPDPYQTIDTDIFGNLDVHDRGYEDKNQQGTLAITDQDRANAQSAIIEEINNERMLELSQLHPELYKQVVAGEVEMPVIGNPHEGKDYTTSAFDGAELAAAEQSVEEEATENTEGESEELVKDAIKYIKKENPKGITVLNDFASWADTVTDSQANLEAQRYLQELKDSPTVDQRFRKAMAISMMAMLFGDDFTTAMNTGFGVVADDYEAEAVAEAAGATAAAELAKTVAKEQRANIENDRRKIRDVAFDLQKLQITEGTAAYLAAKKEIEDRSTNNFKWLDTLAKDSLAQIPAKVQANWDYATNFRSQLDTALDWVKRNKPDVVWDLEKNVDQRIAFATQWKKWIKDKVNNYKPPAFYTYMEDAFIKTELADSSKLTLEDINPTVDSVRDLGINPDDINWNDAKELTKLMSNRVKSLSEKFSELNILKLLVKDYHEFKASDPKGYEDLVYRAAEQGIGGFTSFVNAQTTGSDYLPGTLYDSNIASREKLIQSLLNSGYTKSDLEKLSDSELTQRYIAKWLQNN